MISGCAARAHLLALGAALILGASAAGPTFAEETLPPPDCVRAMRAARIAADAGEMDRAVAELRAAVESHPDELAPLVELWRLELRRGRSPADAVELRRAIAERLQDPDAALGPGLLDYLIQGAGDDAEELELVAAALESRLAAAPGDATMRRTLARVQDRLGLHDEAYENLARAHEQDPREESLWGLVARELEEERWQAVRDRVEPHLVSDGENPKMFVLGYLQSLAALGAFEELEEQLATLDPSSRAEVALVNGLRMRAAWAARESGDDERAELYFRAVLDAEPKNEVAAEAVRLLYADPADGGTTARTPATALPPRKALAEGASLLAAGDHEGALPYLRHAAFEMSDSEIAWYNLGLAALKADSLMEAEEAFGRAARINPSRPDVFLSRGAALTRLERHEEAVEVLDRALAMDRSLKNAHYYLYRAHLALGNDAKAAEHRAAYEAE